MITILLTVACATSHGPPPGTVPASSGEAAAYGPAPQTIARTDAQRPIDGIPVVQTESGLKYWVLREGDGATPAPGQIARVHYTGWLADGTKFDSSRDRGQPLEFAVGQRQVIAGWDEAVGTMKIGELRRLEIPPQLGYGERGAGGRIPPGATLVFEVELVGIKG